MVDKDAFLCFLECLGSHFLLKENHLIFSQLREIIQIIIYRCIIRFVFTTIQHHDASISPIERSIGLVAHIVEMVAQTNGISIADFMVTTHEEYRHLVGLHTFGKLLENVRSLSTVPRVVNTITIEEHKVIIHLFHLFQQRLESIGALMKVIENNGCKFIFVCFRKFESTEFRYSSFSELLAISLV